MVESACFWVKNYINEEKISAQEFLAAIEKIEAWLDGKTEVKEQGVAFMTDPEAIEFMYDFLTMIKERVRVLVQQ